MSKATNFELNRRSRVLHWRDGKITPPFLAKSWQLISQTNFTDSEQRWEFEEYHWSTYRGIFFGSNKPLNISSATDYYVVIFKPQEDHLKIVHSFVTDKMALLFPNEIKGSPMNGLIFPYSWSWNDNLNCVDMKIIRKRSEYWNNTKNEIKLVILIVGDDQTDEEKAENRAFKTAEIMREDAYSMPICIVAQSDNRDKVNKRFDWLHNNFELRIEDNTVLVFRGSDIQASAFVVNTEEEKILEKKFLNWKEKLNFLDSHQVIAFHFTTNDGNEPKNSERIFNDIFGGIPLSTLRLISKPSIIGVNRQIEKEFCFSEGPTYAIIGLRKFGYRNPVTLSRLLKLFQCNSTGTICFVTDS